MKKLLDYEKTLELIKYAQCGDEEAMSLLISENSPLVKSVLKHYRNKGVEYDDLFQLGAIGLIKAVRNFSDSFGVKFSTYAVPMIAGEIKRYLRDDGFIKVSRSTKTLAIKISYYVDDYKAKHDSSPTVEQIAEYFAIDKEEVVFAMDATKIPLSIFETSDDDSTLPLIDKLASAESADNNIDKILLRKIVNELDERERTIILLRYFRDKTQSEVARVMNVSQVQISRIENKILSKLREEFDMAE